ncbi:MAG: YezD family protein [Candidatus Methylacidiphilales bacterium]|nr:YezD family protein [Candidatus Methylacidiphilales bacterium]
MTESATHLNPQELTVVQAIRGLQFGSVEVVIHEGRIVEVNQKRKVRFADAAALKHKNRRE